MQELFEYTDEPLKEEEDESELEDQWGYVVRNVSSWSFESMLYQTYTGTYKGVDFQRVAPNLLRYMETLEKRFLVTQNLLKDPQKPLILSTEDSDLVENPLPIILCYDQSHHIRIFSMGSQEYRTQKPLKLGEDIQTIATDTETNIKRLKAYSDRHHLNLNIISFADLERAHKSLSTEHPLSSQQVLQPSDSGSNTHNVTTMKQPLLSQPTPNRSSNADIMALHGFCAQQQVRLNQTSVLKSLALVGLVVGITRILTGHTFFFSAEKTRRETEFIKIADTMELSARP